MNLSRVFLSCFILLVLSCSFFTGSAPKGKYAHLNEEEEVLLSEVEEYFEQGVSLLQDSLWFEASDRFDSALYELVKLDSLEFNSVHFTQVKKDIKDSLYSLLIRCTYHTSQMQIALPWSEIWDKEMEKISDSAIVAIDSLSMGIDLKKYGLPLTFPLHHRISQAMAVLTGPGRNYFSKWLNRMHRYKPMIEAELTAAGLPRELIYLAMVESGFSPKAWSKAKASGIWQFISATGERYGLTSNWWIDERRDPEKSTRSALKYLKDLYEEFHDWDMAMAGYNCGEGRIRRQLAEHPYRTFWDMELPRETMNYVPKIYAALIIGENPERYGFVVTPEEPVIYDTATVTECVSLTVIAEAAGADEEEIKWLNPELRRWCTPPNVEAYTVKIPKGKRDIFVENYKKLDKTKLVTWHLHRVRRGENLGLIARNYGVSVKALKTSNNLRSNLIRAGQQLLIPIPPTVSKAGNKAGRSVKSSTPKHRGSVSSKSGVQLYVVKEGDNLYDIARKYDVSMAKLMQLNELNSKSILSPGQKIKLPGSGGLSKIGAEGGSSKTSFQEYKVEEGDNLWNISKKLSVTIEDLKRWNKLSNNGIKPGQTLKFRSEKATANLNMYTIQPSDNLWDIANKFGTTVENLKQLNPDLPVILKPGMQLRIK